MKCIEVEEAVARMFDIRRHIIVPNVSWGLFLHECDLLVVRPSGYAIEVEIKVSKSDLKKDAGKKHGHRSHKIKELYFAVPRDLYEAAVEYAPGDAGIICVGLGDTTWWPDKLFASIERPAVTRKDARPLSEGEMLQLGKLGTMRIWKLKSKLIAMQRKAVKA
jgi:hypothetical protein